MTNLYQHQVIYHQAIKPPSNGLAITAMILGILALITGIWTLIPFIGMVFGFLAFLPALLAVVFGHIGQRKAAIIGGIGSGSAKAGLILGYITLGIIVFTTLLWIVALTASSANS